MTSYRILMSFLIPGEQEKVEGAQKKREVEGMGIPEIKYGESMCFMQHLSTGLWLTYAALDAKAARLGTMKRRVWSLLNYKLHDTNSHTWCQAFQTVVFLMILHLIQTLSLSFSQAILHQEGHMDDALTCSRSQMEESQASRMIYSTTGLFTQFIKYDCTSHTIQRSFILYIILNIV